MLNDVYEMMKRERYEATHEFKSVEDEAEFQRYCEEGDTQDDNV